MTTVGTYLYGFTDAGFRPAPELRGLAGAPVRVLPHGDVAAVVSPHPVQPLVPSRKNLEPHHRIVREISGRAALVPAAFGHISESARAVLEVLRDNHDKIRGELTRLDRKFEMGLKLMWSVDNIFDYMVRTDRELRELRDRVFRNRQPSMAEKLDVGALFEATLNRERERLCSAVVSVLQPATCETTTFPPRDEKIVFEAALLVERARESDFLQRLRAAAGGFDSNYTLQYSGPWPVYSFVRLRLQTAAGTRSR